MCAKYEYILCGFSDSNYNEMQLDQERILTK